MAGAPNTPARGSRIGATVALSIVLVPAAALLAVALANPASPEEVPVETTIAATTTTSEASVPAASVVVEPVVSTQADLIAACTVDGIALVEAEAGGEITELQSAALDALRQLCAEAGLEIPGPPPPPPVVRTVTVAGPTNPPAGTANPGRGDDDDRHHEDEDDEHDEDDRDEDEDEDDEDDD